jgi:hypothetical protein
MKFLEKLDEKFFLLIFLLVLFTSFLSIFLIKNSCKNKKAKAYKIGEKKYCLFEAKNEVEWMRGLMNVKKPVDFDGMIFLFPEKNYRTFWNKNTYLDLDVYWLDNEEVVGKDNLPSIEKTKEIFTISSPKPVDRVVEIVR